VPAHLRPRAPVAAEAILVGDPGRALLLAQALLDQPKMSNHARGLWGYWGRTAEGRELTIQATGLGGPSAAAVLADLAELGVRRAVRVGTCTALRVDAHLAELLLVTEAVATEGSATALGLAAGSAVEPDEGLLARLRAELGDSCRAAQIVSLDTPGPAPAAGAIAADMQTVAILARGRALGIATAALLVVTAGEAGEAIEDEQLDRAATRAGNAAVAALSA
jgi:uridine phosphorylase